MGHLRFRGGHTAGWLTFLLATAGASTAVAQSEVAATALDTAAGSPAKPPLATVPPAEAPPVREAAAAPVTSALPVADDVPSPAREPIPKHEPIAQFGATLGMTYESEPNSSVVVTAPVLRGRFILTDEVKMDVDWGFAFLKDSEGWSSRAGNPWAQGWYHSQHASTRWAVGVGATAPVANVTLGMDGRLQRQLYNEVMAMWGGWDMWRWTPGRSALPLTVEFETPLSREIDVEARAAVAPLFGARTGESGTEVVGQASVALCGNGPSARVCPRLQAVVLPSTSLDRLQIAAGLRMTLDWGHLFADLLVNLDEPLGVAGRGTRNWGIQIGKGFDR